MDYYDSEYRRQYCQERVAAIREEYRSVQAPPRNRSQWRERVAVQQIRSIWQRVRRRVPQRAPAYRS